MNNFSREFSSKGYLYSGLRSLLFKRSFPQILFSACAGTFVISDTIVDLFTHLFTYLLTYLLKAN